jgi:CubicO group peptidase (beta-lactamase class C family)
MSLVQRGDLDVATTDVNRYLKRWHLDENGFGDVTIGNLLSHTGGTSVSGFPGYDIGKERPTLIEVLSGAHPANTPEVRVLEPPGRSPRYSGGGYTVLQLLIEDSQNAGFAEWYAGHVLSVVGTTGAFFGEPTSPDQIDSAALAHDEGGKRYATGPWHVYPELAAAGLWISAPDLASVVVFLQKTLAGDPPHAELLSSETAELMVSTHAQLDAFTRMLAGEESIGYGFFLIDRDKDGRAEYFSHGGSNWGYKALFVAHMEKGYGAVVLTNSENGYDACASLIEHIGRKHGWENF